MQKESTDNFTTSVKPLFKKRRIFRILTALAVLVLIFSINSWFFVPGVIFFLIVIFKLFDTEMALKNMVWERFSAQFDSINDDSQSIEDPQQLKGVIGTIGDSHNLSVITQGTYHSYKIRLLKQTVTYNPRSNDSYSRDYRILEITTHQDFYHVFIDSKQNNRNWISTAMTILSLSIRDNQKLMVEGDVNKYFKIYVPPDDKYKSLITLTPEKLLSLKEYGARFDVEFVDDKIYVITNNKIKNVKDILIYQQNVLDLISNIGVDVVRARSDIDNDLTVKTPIVLTF